MATKAQTLAEHQERWKIVREARRYWDREARIDQRFALGKVWSNEELEIFACEGREPTSYDLIRPVLRLMAGTEALNRQDIKVFPRKPSDVEPAEALTKILKYVGDQNQDNRQYSQAFWDSIVTGLGWVETGYNSDPTKEQTLIKYQPTFDMWIDPASRELDLTDALDLFRAVWMRPEDLANLFPKYRNQLLFMVNNRAEYEDDASFYGGGMNHSADYTNRHGDRPPVGWNRYDDEFGGVDTHRNMIRAVERWYKKKEMADFCRHSDGRVYEITPDNADYCATAIVEGSAKPFKALATRVRVAVFAGDLLLQDTESPYSHGKFPFVPMWCDWDEHHRPMGIVRTLRDPAKEFNARRAHALKRALNRQVMYEQGAFPDVDRAAKSFARHNGFIATTPGALSGNKIVVKDDLQSSPIEMDLIEQAQKMIQDVSGATMELLGQESNATSGKAIMARQSQGQATLYTIFDLRNWTQTLVGELTLSNIQDTYTEEQSFRITESLKGLNFITINKRTPEGLILNDITQGKFDVSLDDGPWHITERMAEADEMMTFLGDMPPQIKLMFAQQIADLKGLPTDFVEKLGMVINQLMQAPPVGPDGQPLTGHAPPSGGATTSEAPIQQGPAARPEVPALNAPPPGYHQMPDGTPMLNTQMAG